MSSKRSKEKSLLFKVLIPIALVMVLQSALNLSSLFMRGAVSMLNDNALGILSQIVINRKQNLEVSMTQKWGKLTASSSALSELYSEFLLERGLTDDTFCSDTDASKDFLYDSTPELKRLLRQNGVNGVFLILAGSEGATLPSDTAPQTRQGVCLRDMDQIADYSGEEDLLIERAPYSVVNRMAIPLNSMWTPNYTFSAGCENRYFFNPLQAALLHPDADPAYLGYWCAPHGLSADDFNDVISYSVPLKSDSGRVYGVLGVEVLARYVADQLPYGELNSASVGVYLLCQSDGGDSMDILLKNGFMFVPLFGDRSSVHIKESSHKDCFTLDSDKPSCGAVSYLKLYNPNTPFENERMALVGAVDSEHLFEFGGRILWLLVLTTLVSLSIGIVGIVIVCRNIAKPIKALSNKVQELDPRSSYSLDKIGIEEIDRLISSIEQLGRSVAENRSKLSAIMRITGLSIGACEVDIERGVVYFTDGFFDILKGTGFENREGDLETIEVFEDQLMQLEQYFLEEESASSRIFLIPGETAGDRYVRLRRYEKDTALLCIVMDVTEEFRAKQKLEYERDFDVLTDLVNRRAFERHIRQLFTEPEKLGTGAMIMLDIDNLKYVNDTFGHDHGDDYIKATASALRLFSDENSLVARMSGDEFLVFLYGYDNREQIEKRIVELRFKLSSASIVLPNNANFKVRTSGGIAWYPFDSVNSAELIRYADFAMYQIKRGTKGEIAEFNLEMYNQNIYILRYSSELDTIIEQQLVDYHLQPIIDVNTGEIFAYEALMRPYRTELKTPAEVLTVARAQGKLKQIERLTWFKSMEKFYAFRDAAGGRYKMFINSIPNYVLDEQDFKTLSDVYAELFPRVVMELTEESQSNKEDTDRKLETVRALGMQVAIDDYGSGYNSQKLLLDVSPEYIKIDMNIVHNIDTDMNRQETVRDLLSYAKARGIMVIAEGVETESEFYYIRSAGVDYVQGYLLQAPAKSPPELSADTLRIIRNRPDEA